MKNYSQHSGLQSFTRKAERWLLKSIGAAAFLISPALACAQPTYCPATHSVDCTANYISDVEVVGTTLSNTGSGCTGTSGLAWSTFPASGSTTATLQPGQTYTFNITTTHNSILSVWIDFNQDGTFDASEHTQVTLTSTPNTVNTATITIPATATTGLTGMRIRDRLNGNANGPGDACISFASGETEDYVVTIGTPTPCTGAPTVSTPTANPTASCLNGTSILTATGFGTATGGLTFQWQQAPSNSGPWTNVTGGLNANTPKYTTGPLNQNTWFRLQVVCTNSGQTTNSTPVQVTNTGIPCYCPAPHTATCNTNNIDQVVIPGTTLSNIGSGCANLNAQAYSVYPATGSTTASLQPGQTYSINVFTTANNRISLWIDYNRDGVFDASEHTQVTITSTANTMNTASFTVPVNATPGITGMRVRSRATSATINGPGDACLSFTSGETEDYFVTIVPAPPCSGTPTVAQPTANPASACLNSTSMITAGGFGTAVGGLSFQWEQSASSTGPWSSVTGGSGANTPSLTTGQLGQTTWFRLNVTCTNSGQTTSSAPVEVVITGIPCYCVPIHSAACTADNIDQVEIVGTTLNNNASGCGNLNAQAYSSYPAVGNTTTTLQPGQTYTINVFTTANNKISLWIDYNRDGVFDASEHTQITTTSTANSLNTATFTVPVTATVGLTGMRVRSRTSASPNGPGDACLTFGSGETEDYFVQIGTPTPCAGTPAGGTAAILSQNGCANSTANLTATGATTGQLGINYQWEEANSVNGPWTAVTSGSGGNTINFTTAPLNNSKWYRLVVTCTNSSQSSVSTPIEVVISSIPCYCNSNLHDTNCTGTDNINSVVITGTTLSNINSGCNGTASDPGYSLATSTTNLSRGQTYSLNVTTGSSSAVEFWIDYDRDGVFDANLTEWKLISSATVGGTATNVTFTVPATAALGQTAMRIRVLDAADFSQATPASACNQFSSGETEDYVVTIDAGTGINEALSAAVSLAPNPTSGNITLQLPAALSAGTLVSVFDANGRQVYQIAANGGLSQELNLSGLADGLYVLQTTLNKQTIVKRIAVQK